MMDNNRPLLEIRDLKVTFPHGKNAITAVDSISFSVDRGTTLGIVGESGSGKSTVARAVMQLITPNSGEILFDGQNLTKMSKSELREIRKRTQMVFQDPGGSLNEYMQVGKIITEPLLVHGISKVKELQKRSE